MNDDVGSVEPGSQIQLFLQRYKIPLVLIALSVLLISMGIVALARSFMQADAIEFNQADTATSSGSVADGARIQADIEGAVNAPGLYTLATGARVQDLLTAAGGLTGEADTQYVEKTLNRAAIVSDGSKLYIPRTGENNTSHINSTTGGGDTTSYNSYPVIQQGDTLQNALISINQSSQIQLESLPGVGPVTAGKIIAGRPYLTIQELVVKKAVGAGVFEKIKNLISL